MGKDWAVPGRLVAFLNYKIMIYIILFLYVLPMFINIFFVYKDEETNTIDNLFKCWWAYFIPFLNIFMCLMIPIYYIHIHIEKWWEKIKRTKIK